VHVGFEPLRIGDLLDALGGTNGRAPGLSVIKREIN
jgi:hypothetical protein